MFSASELRDAGQAPAVTMARFGRSAEPHVASSTVAEMHAAGIDAGVLIPMPTPSLDVSRNNAEIAAWVADFPESLVGFGSVNVADPVAAVDELQRCVEELGLVGLKFHPPAQGFFPSDRALDPVWDACVQHNLPIMIHTGTTWWGYSKMKFGRPEFIDEVACDFPELTIIMTHWGHPWWEEAAAVAWRHANVYVDISGYGPRHVPERYVRMLGSVLQDKALFGTDFPALPFDQFVAGFETLAAVLKPEVVDKVTGGNIRRIIPAMNALTLR
jgi:predicted TIM-barrel fold metal-dependent hydrolase